MSWLSEETEEVDGDSQDEKEKGNLRVQESSSSCDNKHVLYQRQLGFMLEDCMNLLHISPNSAHTVESRSVTSQELQRDRMMRHSSERLSRSPTRACRSPSYCSRTPYHSCDSPQKTPYHSCDSPQIALPCNPLPFSLLPTIVLPSELRCRIKPPPSWTRERSRSPVQLKENDAEVEVYRVMGFTSFYSSKKEWKELDFGPEYSAS